MSATLVLFADAPHATAAHREAFAYLSATGALFARLHDSYSQILAEWSHGFSFNSTSRTFSLFVSI
jgi:hypothetical protein